MNKFTALMGVIVLSLLTAWAQTSPATPGAPPAGDTGASSGGVMDDWWAILLTIIVIAAIWNFSHSRTRV
jgi:hypothetical protein